MKIGILHLSDIHLTINNNSILVKQDCISKAISNEILDCESLYITVTGDIAYSGTKAEYIIAEKFFKNLEEKIIAYKKIDIQFIFCPGNHDCDFSIDNEKRNYNIDNIKNNFDSVPYSVVQDTANVQSEYFEFLSKFDSQKYLNISMSNDLIKVYKFNIGTEEISFNSYNLSWISQRKEEQSEIVFPIHCIDTKLIEESNSAITISMLHHPFHWLNYKSIRKFKTLLCETSSIILNGHEHTSESHKIENLETSKKVIHIEGGTLQDSHNKNESKFNLLKIDTETKNHKLFNFNWNGELYIKSTEIKSTLPSTNPSPFKFKDKYELKVHSLGLKIDHSSKDNLTLDDIFIYPDVKIISNSKAITKEISSENFLKLTDDKLKIIYGDDNSGRTTLLKKLQIMFKDKSNVPIILNGNEIDKKDIKDTAKIIQRSFKKQYKSNDSILARFQELDRNEIVILVDDLNKIDPLCRSTFINELEKNNYKNVIIMASNSLKFEGTSDSNLADSLDKYAHFELLEFGHIIRDKFITKWIKITPEEHREDIANSRRDKANRINKTIGLHTVPSHPMYLITLLTAMDSNDTSLEKSSSYGHYYHFLIMKYINNDGLLTHTNVNTIFAYLSELAFEMFSTKVHSYSFDNLRDFNREYIIKADFEPPFKILEKLIKTKILSEDEGSYKFAHKYIYYYFVAVQLSQHLDNPDYSVIVEGIIKRLHNTELANILMFLLHLSPKKVILEKLVIEASQIFKEVEEFSFSVDELTNLNSSIKKDTTHRLNISSLDESRETELRREERKSSFEKKTYVDDVDKADYKAEIPVLDFFSKLNLAYKLIEILGEIVKNYAGSTTVDKDIRLELIKNTYGLGLRSLKIMINTFEIHHEHIVDEIKKVIKKTYEGQDQIEKSIYGFVFNLASAISTDTVKRIAKSLSIKELRKTYDKISDETSTNIAYSLINNAIKLNLPNGLDQEKIISFHKELDHENNLLTDSTLKNLVLSHLYMFETNIKIKSSISAKLGIDTSQLNKEKYKKIV